jgi:Uma2 family endonuclease
MGPAEETNFVSVDDYLSAEEMAVTRSEYIDGWVRAMSGSTIRHNRVTLNCTSSLLAKLRAKPCQPHNSDTKLRIRRHTNSRFYYPDAQVVCDSNPATSVFQDNPVLIIEVLSPSTRAYDLDEKLTAYLTIPSLQCYVILEQHTPFAIVMRRTATGFLRETCEGTESTIDLPFIGCELSLCDIYEGVEFTATCVQESEPEYELTSD